MDAVSNDPRWINTIILIVILISGLIRGWLSQSTASRNVKEIQDSSINAISMLREDQEVLEKRIRLMERQLTRLETANQELFHGADILIVTLRMHKIVIPWEPTDRLRVIVQRGRHIES